MTQSTNGSQLLASTNRPEVTSSVNAVKKDIAYASQSSLQDEAVSTTPLPSSDPHKVRDSLLLFARNKKKCSHKCIYLIYIGTQMQ